MGWQNRGRRLEYENLAELFASGPVKLDSPYFLAVLLGIGDPDRRPSPWGPGRLGLFQVRFFFSENSSELASPASRRRWDRGTGSRFRFAWARPVKRRNKR